MFDARMSVSTIRTQRSRTWPSTVAPLVSPVSSIRQNAEFFDKYEDEIENELDAYGLTYTDLVDTTEFWTMQECKEKAVWFVVEMYCNQRVDAACAVAHPFKRVAKSANPCPGIAHALSGASQHYDSHGRVLWQACCV